jgi:hypothetical protein
LELVLTSVAGQRACRRRPAETGPKRATVTVEAPIASHSRRIDYGFGTHRSGQPERDKVPLQNPVDQGQDGSWFRLQV